MYCVKFIARLCASIAAYVIAGCSTCRISALALVVATYPHAAAAQKAPPCMSFESNSAPASVTSAGTAVSASEASTTQVLEVVAQRRMQETQACPEGFIRIGGTCQQLRSQAADAPFVQSPSTTQGSKPKSPEIAPSQAPGTPAVTGQFSDSGAWVEGFLEYETHSNVPVSGTSTVTRRQLTEGVTTGLDKAISLGSNEGVRLGALTGYSNTSQNFSQTTSTKLVDTTFDVVYPSFLGLPNATASTLVSHQIDQSVEQRLAGLAGGLYASYHKGAFYSDFVAKVDFVNLSQNISGTDTFAHSAQFQVEGSGGTDGQVLGCLLQGFVDPSTGKLTTLPNGSTVINIRPSKVKGFDIGDIILSGGTPGPTNVLIQHFGSGVPIFSNVSGDPFGTSASTSYRNFVAADNIGYRYDLKWVYWIEPIAGFNFAYTNFDSSAAALGFKDGEDLRLQAGAKFGQTSLQQGSYLWTNAVGTFVYSDVYIHGFVNGNLGFSPSSVLIDEGKLRFLGLLESKVDFLNGVTLYADLTARAGEDLWAVGGRIGGRVRW
jgi:hypothetical protein